MIVDSLKSWIINIGCTLFFITAVEMILPNNSMKKYAKFVLGLVLITVVISPVLSIFYGGVNNSAYANKILTELQGNNVTNNIKNYQEKNIENTLSTFQDNLKVSLEKMLKDKFSGYNFAVQAVAEYNKENNEFQIRSITVKTSCVRIEDVESFLVQQLSISKDNIKVLKDK